MATVLHARAFNSIGGSNAIVVGALLVCESTAALRCDALTVATCAGTSRAPSTWSWVLPVRWWTREWAHQSAWRRASIARLRPQTHPEGSHTSPHTVCSGSWPPRPGTPPSWRPAAPTPCRVASSYDLPCSARRVMPCHVAMRRPPLCLRRHPPESVLCPALGLRWACAGL